MKLPPPNSRVAFIGPTGCGKTVLATRMLQNYPNVIVIDPKHQFTFDNPKFNHRIATKWPQFLKYLDKSRTDGLPVIWRPPEDMMEQEDLDRVYGLAFKRGNTLVYMDELYFLTNGSSFGTRTPWFRACVTAGRSKGIGVWSAFQRPAWIPLIALTETEVRCIFYLRDENDQKRIKEIAGPLPWNDIRPKGHSKYKFIISTDQWNSPPYRLKLGDNQHGSSPSENLSSSSDSSPNH